LAKIKRSIGFLIQSWFWTRGNTEFTGAFQAQWFFFAAEIA